jgi:hypothetical protein
MFIGGSGKVTAKLPAGTYFMRTGTGYDWYGPNEAFGESGYYDTLLFDDGTEYVTLQSGYEYTLLLNTSYNDPDYDDVGSEYTDYGDF